MIDRIRKLASAVSTALEQERAMETAELSASMERGLAEIEAEMGRLRRAALDNHALIEEVIRQRDQWAQKWRQHGAEHAAAQGAMLDAILGLDKAIATRLLPELNAYREKEGLPPLTYASAAERYKVIVGEYQTALDKTAEEHAKMPSDQLERRVPVETTG